MNSTTETIEQLSRLIEQNPDDPQAYYRRGSLYWKLGQRAAAITDFNTSARIDPDGPGAVAAEHAMAIMSFFNHDQFNP